MKKHVRVKYSMMYLRGLQDKKKKSCESNFVIERKIEREIFNFKCYSSKIENILLEHLIRENEFCTGFNNFNKINRNAIIRNSSRVII